MPRRDGEELGVRGWELGKSEFPQPNSFRPRPGAVTTQFRLRISLTLFPRPTSANCPVSFWSQNSVFVGSCHKSAPFRPSVRAKTRPIRAAPSLSFPLSAFPCPLCFVPPHRHPGVQLWQYPTFSPALQNPDQFNVTPLLPPRSADPRGVPPATCHPNVPTDILSAAICKEGNRSVT